MPESHQSATAEAAATRRLGVGLAALLAVLHFFLATSAIDGASSTFDEGLHIASGMANLLTGDQRLHSGNGLLPQVWLSLPLASAPNGFTFPNPDRVIATQSVDDFHLLTHFLAHVFFYELDNDPAAILAAARAQSALVGAALCCLVFVWARWTWGTGPAVLACGLAALSPNLLAHAGLATSDLMFTTWLLAASGAVWWSFWQPRPVPISLAGLALGALALSKTSAVLAVPMVGLLWVLRATWPAPLPWLGGRHLTTPLSRAGALAACVAVQGALAVAVIWGAYGLRYEVVPEGTPGREGMAAQWEWVHERESGPLVVIDALREWRVLPEGFLFGTAFVLRHSEERNSFFRGTTRIGGDWRFFPYAMGVKTPLALFALLALAAARVARSPAAARRHVTAATAPLLVLIAVQGGAAVASNINLGLRHVLPLYPALFVLAGGAAWGLTRAYPLRGALVGALALGFAGASLAARPYYLAYFNSTVGPEHGYRVLVDSSLDWGQDLDRLARYLKEGAQRDDKPVYLAYFGSADPMFHDLDVRLLPGFFDWATIQHREAWAPLDWALEPGLYAISATRLQQAWSGIPRRWGPREWAQYGRLRARFAPLEQTADPAAALRGALRDPATREAWLQYRALRLARLCEVLRRREPDGHVGHSILLYEVGPEELGEVTALPSGRAAASE